MAASKAHKQSIQTSSNIYSYNTNNQWPLELVWPGKDYRRSKGKKFEKVLKRCFNSRKRPTVSIFDFLQ